MQEEKASLEEVEKIFYSLNDKSSKILSILKSLNNSIVDSFGEQNQKISILDIENILNVLINETDKLDEEIQSMTCLVTLRDTINKLKETNPV